MSIIRSVRPKRYFYMKDANMNWSFDTLASHCKAMLGGEPEVGDILIADNSNKTKRKVLQWTPQGFMIYYGRLHKVKGVAQTFTEISEHNGMVYKADIGKAIM